MLLLWGNAAPVAADPPTAQSWYEGRAGRKRLLHIGITLGFGVTYLATTSVLKTRLSPSQCRWCDPPGFDRSIRNVLVWDNTNRAERISTIEAYVLAPIVGLSLLIAADHNAGWARILDDIIPVAETVAVSQVVVEALKFSVGRQRPLAHFADPGRLPETSDNASFISGHSALGFSITASAGMICHWRHYWTEPYVWGTGIALSLSVEYLRMGADKHYFSDVVAGGGVGIAAGVLIPRLMREDIAIVPINNGVAFAGIF